MAQDHSFRLALVTGASSGIGEALCRLLAKEKVHLLITGRNSTALHHLADELRSEVNVVVYPADLSVSEDRKKLVQKIQELHPDLIINNAGFGYYGKVYHIETSEQLDMIEVNCKALMELTIEAAKTMINLGKKGVIMNVSSVAAYAPFPGMAAYCASKSLVNTFSLAMDREVRESGLRVLVSCPGRVKTSFSTRASKGKYQGKGQKKMTSEYAAEQIWTQIIKRKPIVIFDRKYRFLAWLIKYIIPTQILTYLSKDYFKKYEVNDN